MVDNEHSQKFFWLMIVMIRINYLILCFSPILFAVSVPNAVENWENDKVAGLNELIEIISKHSSGEVTVVASENVHNENGTLKEIRTVELIIPNVINKKRSVDPEEYLEKLKQNDEEIEDTLLKMQRDFRQTFDHKNIDTRAGYQKRSESGDVEWELYATKDETLYEDTEGVAYYNRENITVSDHWQLGKDYMYLFGDRPNTTILSPLFWDGNGKFDRNQSYREPMLLAHIDEASESASEKMMDHVLEALTFLALEYPDNVAKGMSIIMSKKYRKYTWFVTEKQEENVASAYYDVFIEATYDNVDLGVDVLKYSVFGLNK